MNHNQNTPSPNSESPVCQFWEIGGATGVCRHSTSALEGTHARPVAALPAPFAKNTRARDEKLVGGHGSDLEDINRSGGVLRRRHGGRNRRGEGYLGESLFVVCDALTSEAH